MEFRISKKLLMGGITVDVDEEQNPARTREERNSPANSLVCANHRRSKSATDRKLHNQAGGTSRKDFNDLHLQSSPARTSWARSPLQEYSTNSNTNTSPSNRASLEQDIEQLQSRLQQEKSMRMMLERAMGRASSTLSPGHRHFTPQTKELVDEIELLEEEVANREQHVLALYRSIFDQCVSRPTSQQSSVTSSPAHKKNESRKHPSIISSSFCSSKTFHLQPFRALASMNDSGKRSLQLQSKTSHLSLPGGKPNNLLEKTRSNHGKVQKPQPKLDKTSVLRTLKDHLHQCPSKLSEEMVRCMASIYCWLRNSASVKLDRKESPLISRSSTNVAHLRNGISQNRGWFCKSTIEISTISTDKKHFSRASYAISNYRALVEQLERVNVTQMETNAKIAFWINTYNSLVMHAYLAYGTPHGSLRRLALFHKAAYNISGCIVSANAIEQAIFCFRTPRVGRWFEIILSTAMRKRSREERHRISSKFSISDSPSLVSLALCTGAFSDPTLKVYTPSNVREELEETAREFLQANVVVKDSKKVFLPKVLERFAKESSLASDDLINWVADNVDKELRESIQNCIDRKTSRKASQVIEWLPYSSKFRYLLSKELLEKPWWV